MASPMAMGIAGNLRVLSTMEAVNTTVLREAARDCWTNVVLVAHILAMKVANIASAEMQIAPIGSMCDIMTHAIWTTALIGVCKDALARKIQSPSLNIIAIFGSSLT